MIERPRPPTWAIRTHADRRAVDLGYWWDQEAGDRIIGFVRKYIRIQFDDKNPQAFEPLPWQENLIRSLYSWRHPETGHRRFRRAIVHCSKSNGKTMLAAILTLYELYGAGNRSPQVASGSTNSKNAMQIFKEVAFNVRNNGWDENGFKVKITDHRGLIRSTKNNSTYWATSLDSGTIEGENIILGICDEYAWHRSSKLYDAMVYNIKRPNSLIITITTAGPDITHPYHALYLSAKRILNPDIAQAEVDDLITYCEVHEADPTADLENDRSQWYKANPSMGVPGLTESEFADMMKADRKAFGSWQNFKLRKLNIWCSNADRVWLQPHVLTALPALDISDEELSQYPCAGGWDGSAVEDPSSFALCWALPDNKFYVKSWGWVCEEGYKRREKSLLRKYDQFVKDGELVKTPGDRIDDQPIFDFILDQCQTFQPKVINCDHTMAYIFMGRLEECGFKGERWSMSQRYFDEPMKQFEAAVNSGRLITPVKREYLLWNLQNVRAEVNKQGQVRPDSGRSVDHIDAGIAILQAFGGVFPAAHEVTPQATIYDDPDTAVIFV